MSFISAPYRFREFQNKKKIVRWFNVEELDDGCGVFPNDVQPTGCVRDGQSYEYGYAQWKGETGSSNRCFCYPKFGSQMAITSANTLVKEARTAGILIKERNSHDDDSKSIL